MLEAPRILVSAYACEPGKGSEPGIGWNVVRELAREFEVWVVTRANNQNAIESATWDGVPSTPRFIYHDLPRNARLWKRGRLSTQVYYALWQRSLAGRLPQIAAGVAFDVVQHVTFGRYWIASPLADLGVPFVFGPVGGGDSVPADLRRALSPRGRAFNRLREVTRQVAERSPRLRRSVARAAFALGTTPATAAKLRSLGASRVAVEPAVGLTDHEVDELRLTPLPSAGPVRFLSVGALLAWKGFELGLRAFAKVAPDLPGASYRIVGDGPERDRLSRLSDDLGVGGSVRFLGQVPRSMALQELGAAHALIHPSLHDSGGWVCLEAMAMARPVICLDLAGPAVLVPGEAGFRVSPATPALTIDGIGRAMYRVATETGLRRQMGLAGRAHVDANFRWSERGKRLRELCHRAVEDGAGRQ